MPLLPSPQLSRGKRPHTTVYCEVLCWQFAVRPSISREVVNVRQLAEAYSVDKFLDLTEKAVSEIHGRGKPVVAVGGTAMYIKALLHGLFEGPGTDEAIRNRLQKTVEETGLGAGVLNDPIQSVVWLAQRMAQYGQKIEPGNVILSGSFIRPVECPSETCIHADFGPFGSVSINFA